MPDELVLYVKKSCPWCIEAEEYLEKNGYTWREVDVQASGAAFSEMQKISGQRYVPTLTAGSKILADFGASELAQFLKTENILPAR